MSTGDASGEMNRRTFLQQTGKSTLAVGLGLASLGASAPGAESSRKNAIPKWKGFNLLDFFSPDPARARPATAEIHLQWMADWGFDFVRVPMAYPAYLDIDYNRNITAEEVYRIDEAKVARVDALVETAHRHGLHVSLNLHRAPGYCVNAGFHEPFNLWFDREAQEAFYFHWEMWSQRYAGMPRDKISFDLLNEPGMRADMNDQHSARGPVPGRLYREIAKTAAERIRQANPNHLVIADGNETGAKVIPEIADLDIAQSCRGYHPGIISHYKAPWAMRDIDNLPEPKWPGQVGDQYLSRALLEDFYRPWIALKNSGVGVHCGECGAYNRTPHDVFLAWFGDVLDILSSNGIGFALWEFSGDFGILNSGRTDVAYEDWHGQQLDRALLELLRRV